MNQNISEQLTVGEEVFQKKKNNQNNDNISNNDNNNNKGSWDQIFMIYSNNNSLSIH